MFHRTLASSSCGCLAIIHFNSLDISLAVKLTHYLAQDLSGANVLCGLVLRGLSSMVGKKGIFTVIIVIFKAGYVAEMV